MVGPRSSEASFLDTVPLRGPNGERLVAARTVQGAIAIASAVFATDAAAVSPERLSYLEREFEDFLARSGPRARLMLSSMIWLVVLVAPLLIGKLGPLGALSPGDRMRALDRLERGFGEPLVAVKAILCLLYYEHPDAAREVGFDGECRLPGGAR